MVEQLPKQDNAATFEQLWEISNELRQKLEARFQLQPDPSTKDLQSYASFNGESQGSIDTFVSSEIDWLVHSWLRNSTSGFTNIHLTIWLRSHIRIPHLAYAFGTFPPLFFYMDYVPRTDLLTDLAYLDRYYEPANQTFLKLQADPRLTPFISKNLYMRQSQSHTSLCYTCPIADETIDLVRTVAHEMLDRWLTWVEEAEPVPENRRAALAERDLLVRRAIVERDPANQMAVQFFGKELTEKLVRSLWGGDRISEN
ncbi:MAG TPA: hypothetical protein V6D28_03955 [Leptolyngbyaceae cyanobacterium]